MNTDHIWNDIAVNGQCVLGFTVLQDLRDQLLDEAMEEGVRLEFRRRETGGTVIYLRRQYS
jgi:hypothetical protein